ncbi:hypothetical protein GCM10009825_25400 [Arthrobacter humicola]|uniref:Lipopolysaccharide assembly protein A domain-containing protein n=1 Tax=Arthrobacter humicola TaxID=409291 RepID=A0ABN2Z9F8_9MICC
MTQTPRGFDPNDSYDAPTTQYPRAADRASGSAEEGANTGIQSGPDLGSPAPAAPAAATGIETPRPETPGTPAPAPEARQVTRAGMVWAAVACALVVLILLIAFILQNQEYVQVKFFGLTGSVPLGIALFIAAVGGGVLVAIAGAARIIQLRLAAHRQRAGRQSGAGARTR